MRSAPIFALGLLVLALGCAGQNPAPQRAARPRPLVVGTNADSPPYSFRRDDAIVGLEMDLAQELGRALDRRVEIVDLHWDDLLDELTGGRVDVVMAGMTATAERSVRVAFGEPYMRTSIAVLVRQRDSQRFRARDAVCASPIDVGVVAGTTGEKYLRARCPAMIPRLYPTARDAVLELRQRRVDGVADDAPVLLWMLAQYGSELDVVPTSIANEPLAWAFRPADRELRDASNAALAALRRNGELDRIIERWVPQRKRLETP